MCWSMKNKLFLRFFSALFLLFFFFVSTAQTLEVKLLNKAGEPIPYAVVAGGEEQIFLSNLEGYVWLPDAFRGAEIRVFHLTYRDTVLTLMGADPFTFQLEYAIRELNDQSVEISPTDEKDLMKSAIRNFQESWLTRPSLSLAQAWYTVTNQQGEELSYTHDFGLYTFQGLLDRSKGENEWAYGGHNGMYPQERRRWEQSELLEQRQYWSFRYDMARHEVHGFFNDVLVLLNKMKPTEADSSYRKDNAYFYVFDYRDNGAHIRLHIHADRQALSRIESFAMPMPGKRNRIRGVDFSYLAANFSYEGDRAHLSKLEYKGPMADFPELNFDFSLEVAGKGRLWALNWTNNQKDSFFRSINTKGVVYRPEFWNHSEILSRISEQNKAKRSQYDYTLFTKRSLEERLAEVEEELNQGLIKSAEANRRKEGMHVFEEFYKETDAYFESLKATWVQSFFHKDF